MRSRSERWTELVAAFPTEYHGVRRRRYGEGRTRKPRRDSAAVQAAHREAMERREREAQRAAAVRRLARHFRPSASAG